ncbi:hypothetical protein [Methylobacterium nodulans]|uniref:hypothetical protein n=1 Tax=Methylobacterium nodulans TaxID=114616 RepID=UPI0012ECCF1F|nr:hypothetical protein [Methylobacterium nodulans]
MPVEFRIRASAFWALLTALCGIVLGRFSQLVYDPKVIARLQLLDWLNDIDRNLEGVTDPAQRAPLQIRLDSLRRRLAARTGDAASLQPEVYKLETDVDAARSSLGMATGSTFSSVASQNTAKQIGRQLCFLRWVAGVSPVPLQDIYDWMLPVIVVLTLAALTIVFVLQQYGGSGTAETFGSGGLSDYAGLFLAGVASEVIVGGLRAVKLK